MKSRFLTLSGFGSAFFIVFTLSGCKPMHISYLDLPNIDDDALIQQIHLSLEKRKILRDAVIEIKCNEGVVKLSGYVKSPLMASHIEQHVAQVEGVKSVKNKLRIKVE